MLAVTYCWCCWLVAVIVEPAALLLPCCFNTHATPHPLPTHTPGCKTCSSSGVKPGTSPTTCTMCQGTGQLIQAVRTPLGAFQQVTACGGCEGQGQRFTACSTCGGDGRQRENKRIQLTVPAGGYCGLLRVVGMRLVGWLCVRMCGGVGVGPLWGLRSPSRGAQGTLVCSQQDGPLAPPPAKARPLWSTVTWW
jgi:hypothetical protein